MNSIKLQKINDLNSKAEKHLEEVLEGWRKQTCPLAMQVGAFGFRQDPK